MLPVDGTGMPNPIKSFVIFDLEATGLPSYAQDYPVRIMEIAMTTFQRSDVEQQLPADGPEFVSTAFTPSGLDSLSPEQHGMVTPKRRLTPDDGCPSPERRRPRPAEPGTPSSPSPASIYSPLPSHGRIRNCLLLTVNPRKQVLPHVTELTGLDNELLEGQAGFDSSLAELLRVFLTRLPQPVCLVAHNGDGYDFPLLAAELRHAGATWVQAMDVMCADTLPFFQEAWLERDRDCGPLSAPVHMLDDRTLCCDHAEPNDACLVCTPALFVDWHDSDANSLYETTRVDWRRAIRCRHEPDGRCVVCDSVPGVRAASAPAARRRLFGAAGLPSMKLQDVFERRFGRRPERGHLASADVETLALLCLSHGERFFDWADRHCCRLAEVKEMWRRPEAAARRAD